ITSALSGQKTGPVQAGVAQFDFGSQDVLLTGDPTVSAPPNTDAKLLFKTLGDLTIDNLGGTGNGGGPYTHITSFEGQGTDILVRDADMSLDADASGNGGALKFVALNSLTVDPSKLSTYASSGPVPLTGGSIHLEGGDQVAVLGAPGDLTELFARGVNQGGSVDIKGTGPLSSAVVRDTFIDVSSPGASGQGGTVNLDGKALVQLQGLTAIDASGPTPGAIRLTSLGSLLAFGTIELDSQAGPIGLWTENSAHGLGTPPAAGNIDIHGAPGSVQAIQFDASGGGDIRLSGNQDIEVWDASFNLNGGSDDAGRFLVGQYNSGVGTVDPARTIDFRDVMVDANSSAGLGGDVRLIGGQEVRLGPGTDIMADGGTGPGGIIIRSPGPVAGTGGAIILETFAEAGKVNLSAKTIEQGFFSLVSGQVLSSPDINIHGQEVPGPVGRTVELTAVNPSAGGLVRLSTPGNINVFGAAINVGGEGQVQMGNWVLTEGYNLEPAQSISIGGTLINGNSAGGAGSQVRLFARDGVSIMGGFSPSTDIQVNGGVGAGTIDIQAQGGGINPSQVSINAGAQGFVRLSAQQIATLLGNLPNGNTEIVGAFNGDVYSINITSWRGSDGGSIFVGAPEAITIRHAYLGADGFTGGNITLFGNNITLEDAVLNAPGFGGPGGTIRLDGALAGLVSITDSELLAGGSSSGGRIYLRGGEVDFYGVNTINAGPTGNIYIFRNTGNSIPGVTGNLFTYTYGDLFTIGDNDTVNSTEGRIYTTASGQTRATGLPDTGSGALFDLGGYDFRMTGNPVAEAGVGQDFRVTVIAGNVTIENFGGSGTGGPEASAKLVQFVGNDILVRNSNFGVDCDEFGSGQLFLTASQSLTVDPSTLRATDTEQREFSVNPGGTINLYSDGTLSFFGAGQTDALMSKALVFGTDGGTVSMNSNGANTGDKLFLKNALIDASSVAPTSQLPAVNQGGNVLLDGRLLVRIEGITGIQADGPQAGQIRVNSAGTATTPGAIELDATDGPIGLTAQAGVNGLPPVPPPAGTIGIIGAGNYPSQTISFSAAHGRILLSGSGSIGIKSASFDVGDPFSDAISGGGDFWVGNYNAGLPDPLAPAAEVDIATSFINASSALDAGGEVKLIGAASARLGSGTEINANGNTAPGTIIVRSPGPAAGTAGMVFLEASDGSVNLSAKTSGFVPPSPGNSINIAGQEVATPAARSVELDAVNPGAGGTARLSALDSINVSGASIRVGGEGRVQMGHWQTGGYLDPADSINVSGTIINGNSGGGSGSEVEMLARTSVTISGGTSPSTDIQMNGAVGAGDMDVQAQGNASTAGQVTVNAGAQGYVRLSAQQTAAVLAALPNGNVEIVGVDKGGGVKSINVVAASPLVSGQQINITAIDAIKVQQARLTADGYLQGGAITLAANNIILNNAILSASATGPSGIGGIINLNGGAAGLVSLTDSALFATGLAAGGNIYIRGGTIDFANANTLNAGPTGNVYLYGTVSGTPTVTGTLTTGPYQAP
ncbi:MAG: hypothetical protein HZA91_01230, partial [Verrucomicrobia bacterium]|nr:hypothetical protein [Verrucomicrobiota bacterium]